MQNNTFENLITKLLQEMSVQKKDEWILTKAKLIPESDQQDFIMSLTGEKKITYMPTEAEIEEFCKKVNCGDIYVEYESHYCEFNSEGRYINNWEKWHNDPQEAFPFLDRVFRGCHDLIQLGEYELAEKILNNVCLLEFQVIKAEASEIFENNSPFTIVDAIKENLLTMDSRTIGYDWIKTLLLSNKNNDNLALAKNLIAMLHGSLCEKINLSDYLEIITDDLLDDIEQVLEEEAKELNTTLENILDTQNQWREKRIINSKIARNRHLLLDLQKKFKNKDICINNSKKTSILLASWKQIGELLQTLSYALYIDDQLEITEIEDICQALIKRGKFEEEPWELRKTILKDIVTHEFYDYYSCYDSMKDLSENLYITEDEIIAYADMLNATDTYAREAADLYRKHGKIEKYVQYLETHLDKSSKEYVELIEYYHNIGNDENARHIAQQGLNNCRDDLTELFIFLLHDAKKYGETETYKKLYTSAKRRKKANIVRIDNSLKSIT